MGASGGGASGGAAGIGGSAGSGGIAGSSGGAFGGTGGTEPGGEGTCASPLELVPQLGQYRGLVARSTSEFDGCAGEGPEVVLHWQPPAPGRYLLDTFGSRFDTVLYAGSALDCSAAVPQTSCNDDFDGLDSLLSVTSPGGEGLFIVIDSYNSSGGDYTLNIRGELECVSPDSAELGFLITEVEDFASAAGLLRADSVRECGGGDVGVSIPWRALATGPHRFDTSGSEFDTVLAIRRGCDGERLACNDDAGGSTQAAVTLEVEEGEVLYIEIGHSLLATGALGVARLEVTQL